MQITSGIIKARDHHARGYLDESINFLSICKVTQIVFFFNAERSIFQKRVAQIATEIKHELRQRIAVD